MFRANDVCHLGVVRTLAALDVDVVSVVWSWHGALEFFSDRSRYLGRVVRISNPGSEPHAARADIQKLLVCLAKEYTKQVFLMPTSDSILNFLLASPVLWPLARLANAWDFETMQHLLDKFNLSQKIRSTSINQPITLRCTEDAVRRMRLPFVIKPSLKDSVNSFYAEFNGAKAIYVGNETDRVKQLSTDLWQRYPLIIQEYIKPASNSDDIPVYLATDGEGEIIHVASVEKVFTYPKGFGTAYIVKEQSALEFTIEALKEFVSTTAVRGLIMLEFIRGIDGKSYFIEANPRPWLLVDFQRLRGRNYFYYLDSSKPKVCPEVICANTFYVELTGFCRALELSCSKITHAEIPKFLDSLLGPKRLSTFDESDPGPMEAELASLRGRYGAEFVRNIRNVLDH